MMKLIIYLIFLYCLHTIHTKDINIISKMEWGGQNRAAELTKLILPVNRVIIMHSAGIECNTKDSCSQQLRNIQKYQMTKLYFDDIAYNFLIGNDGNVYEGRGWDQQGAFARGYNNGSLGITFIGNFDENLPNNNAMESLKNLLSIGLNTNKLSADYRLLGHRQVSATNSPGDKLYIAIQQLPHWNSTTTV